MPRAAKTAAAAEGGNTQPGAPTATESRFLFALVGNFKTKPDVAWEEVAEAVGLKSAKSAQERWRLIRRKYNIVLPDDVAPADPAVPAAETLGNARKGKKNKPAVAIVHEDDNDDEEDEDDDDILPPMTAAAKSVPAVAPRKRGRKPAAAVASDGGEAISGSEQELENPAKRVKGKGKGKVTTKVANAGVAAETTSGTTISDATTPAPADKKATRKKNAEQQSEDSDADVGVV